MEKESGNTSSVIENMQGEIKKVEENLLESHAETVPENLCCLICYEDIGEDNYIEYKVSENSEWYPCKFCKDCTEILLQGQFHNYMKSVQKSDCVKEQKSLIESGPPINVKDKNGFPQTDGKEVHSLWFFSDKQIHSAKLDGSVVGEERIKLWEELKKFLIKDNQ